MSNESIFSIKTLDVTGLKSEPTNTTAYKITPLVGEEELPQQRCFLTSISGSAFITFPESATLNVKDKKYSEVFREVFSLRQPEDEDDPLPTESAYWNALRTVAVAYSILRFTYSRSVNLVKPTAVVDSSGGVRLIWRTANKQVKANFGGQPNLRSYLYYESGQDYEVEILDGLTLARRLGWLV